MSLPARALVPVMVAALVAGLIVALGEAARADQPPDETTTGVPAGVTLTPYDGPLTITTAGTVLDGYAIEGCLDIKADNVTIRNSRIRCDNGTTKQTRDQIVRVHAGSSGTLLEHVELDGRGTPWTMGIMGSGITVRYADIHSVGDGIKASGNSVYEHNYVHDMSSGDDQHNDGIQMSGGHDTVVRHNRIVHRPEQTSAVIIKADAAPIYNLMIEDNWFEGGNYTLYVIGQSEALVSGGSDTPHEAHHVTVRNNHFSTSYKWGPLHKRAVDHFTWECNRWDHSGEIVPYDHPDSYVEPSATDTIIEDGCDDGTTGGDGATGDDATTTEDTGDPGLVYSVSSDRSDPQPLDGAVVSGDIYVFVSLDSDVDVVDFSVDGAYYRTEQTAPFDLEGEVKDENGVWQLVATDTTAWSEGEHVVGIVVTMNDGSSLEVAAALTVDNLAEVSDTDDTDTGDTATTLHVADLDATLLDHGGTWQAIVVVSVRDSAGTVVEAADVTTLWSDGSLTTCNTDSRGLCAVAGPELHKRTKKVGVSVEDVTHPELAYDPASNSDPDGDSDGTTILVAR